LHPSVMQWTAEVVTHYRLAEGDTLEVGSYDVNGTVRPFFTGRYVGCDIAHGPGVDVIADAEFLPWDPETWDTVISTEMLEHCPRPWVAVKEMARVLKPGGHLLLTARGYDERGSWEVHGYPHDYWRFSELSFRLLAEDADLEVLEVRKDPEGPGWMLAAVK
jgi:SAM-dependent methyltransferase